MAKPREIVLPSLTSYQKEVYDWLSDSLNSGKVAVIKSVRQSGKSFFCMVQLIAMSFTHKGVSAVIEPTLEQSRNMFNMIVKSLENSDLIKNANAQTLNITFINGSQILFRSTQQGDSNRGYTVSNVLVLDECAFLDDDAIYTILPLVNAHNAPIIICSTPFTMDGYYFNMYLEGLKGKPNIKTFDWSKEKEIERFLTEERKEFYKHTMSRAKFTTEILGEFLTDQGLLFNNLENCIKENPSKPTFAYIGIDWGSGSEQDYTVLSVINELGEQYKVYKTHNLTPMQQVEWASGLINNLVDDGITIKTILAEVNSIGKVYIDALNLRLKNVNITDFQTSNKSKSDLVTLLQIALENNDISILNDIEQLNELKRYEATINPKTKVITYNGKGAHDDTVIALMLAWKAYKSSFGTYSFNFGNGKKKITYKQLREKYGN